jgi:hypothetical protein
MLPLWWGKSAREPDAKQHHRPRGSGSGLPARKPPAGTPSEAQLGRRRLAALREIQRAAPLSIPSQNRLICNSTNACKSV